MTTVQDLVSALETMGGDYRYDEVKAWLPGSTIRLTAKPFWSPRHAAVLLEGNVDLGSALDDTSQTYLDMLDALKAMLEAQSARRHPLGAPDEGIATLCAEAASKARAAIAKAEGRP